LIALSLCSVATTELCRYIPLLIFHQNQNQKPFFKGSLNDHAKFAATKECITAKHANKRIKKYNKSFNIARSSLGQRKRRDAS